MVSVILLSVSERASSQRYIFTVGLRRTIISSGKSAPISQAK